MKFLADEGVDRQIVERLRHDGHNVIYVAESASGISDDEVLESSNRAGAVLLITDKDFGELVFRQRRIASGIVLVRLPAVSQETKAATVAMAIERHAGQLTDSFMVVKPGTIRIRRRIN